MESQEYKIIAPKQVQRFTSEPGIPGEKEYLVELCCSQVCDADAKYYFGLRPWFYKLMGFRYLYGVRDKEKFMKKYPLTPLHEAVGMVLARGPEARLVPKTRVVLVPNQKCKTPDCKYCAEGHENCCPNSRFRSSNAPGFARTHMVLCEDEVVEIPGEVPDEVAVHAEMSSVAYTGILAAGPLEGRKIGVYGDGYMGFILAALLSKKFKVPREDLVVFGVHDEKLKRFSDFAETYNIRTGTIPKNLELDSVFECVGKRSAEKVLDSAIELVKPMGTIVLLGVSEEKVPVNTRDILSKSLTLKGVSRSPRQAYPPVLEAMRDRDLQALYSRLGEEKIKIKNEKDIEKAFEAFMVERKKLFMEW